jgi:hypothetical protein
MESTPEAQRPVQVNVDEPEAPFGGPGSPEYDLLYGGLKKPPPRIQRGNAHQTKPDLKARLRTGFKTFMKEFIGGFSYSKVEENEIRILCLKPGLGGDPLRALLFKRKIDDAKDGYEALSYCWGDPNEIKRHKIYIRDLNETLPNLSEKDYKDNARGVWQITTSKALKRNKKFEYQFPIRRNLHQALMRLRSQEHPVNIWVDAICIDQSERGKLEKQQQLAMMAQIYNYASNVCIWLGEGYVGAEGGIQLIKDVMNFKNFDSLMDAPMAKERWSHLIEIMKATWFSRRWIIQEVALSRNATVHCNNLVVHWDDFADAVSLLTEKIETIRSKFREEVFDDIETTSACILVHILTNICRKSDEGQILRQLLDLETLASTLLGFQASFARDTIYSILSLARDPPIKNEKWETLHLEQLDLNHELGRTKKSVANSAQSVQRGLSSTSPVGLTPDYKVSTRDLFVAFVTRCIARSGCLDIICRHWAPRVSDETYRAEVSMPSWISDLSNTPYGIPGTLRGRQNGENFVAYSPHDQRKRYDASGSYKAEIRMLVDPSLNPRDPRQKPMILPKILTAEDNLTQSPLPSPSLEKYRLHPIDEDSEYTHVRQKVGKLPVSNALNGPSKSSKTIAIPSIDSANVDAAASVSPATPNIEVTSPQQRSFQLSTLGPQLVAENTSSEARRLKPSRKPSRVSDVEREHHLSGIMAVKGFILGKIKMRSEVMRGGIIPGEWIRKMGWDIEQNEEENQNRVPDTLWRLLVADRTSKGDKPPQWYKRACLHGLVDARVSDAGGNLHSVMPFDRNISQLTTKYFKRVESVVWNRRLIEVETIGQFASPLYGLAPKHCGDDDLICVLLGCTVPVVLKKIVSKPRISDLYEIVGEAYVHGMMDGEAVLDGSLVSDLTREFRLG